MRLPAHHIVAVAAPAATQLRDRWLTAAAHRAGIDLATWDPDAGIGAIRSTVHASYRYYGRLALDHPELQWAAMANLISPTFAAAFDGLADLDRALNAAGRGPVRDAMNGVLARLRLPDTRTPRELERRMLSMQREIWMDQSMMHEAYLGDGIAGVRALRDVGLIDDHAVRAWEMIDDGARRGAVELVVRGNEELLRREQLEIVADDYDAIRALRSGGVLQAAMGSLSVPAIPGASSAARFAPVRIGPFRLPVARIDITDRNDRWAMAVGDTLPAFQRLRTNDAARMRALLATSTADRIRNERLAWR